MRGMFFKVAQKVHLYLGNLRNKVGQQELFKIAQSGHTVAYLPT